MPRWLELALMALLFMGGTVGIWLVLDWYERSSKDDDWFHDKDDDGDD
jgi:hypothetical protein